MVTSIESEIIWGDSFQKGIETAKSKNTPIVLDLYTDWCGYCKILENKIFPEPEVSKLLENFITLRINAEEFPEIAKTYRITSYPTVLFLDKNGAYLDRIVGLPSTMMLVKKLKEVYDKRNIEELLLTSLKSEPDSVILNYRLGVYYFKAFNFDKSENYFLKAHNSSKTDYPEKKMESLFNIGIIQIQEKKYSQAISIWTMYLLDYPGGDEASARYYRGISYYFTGKKSEAKDDLQRAKFLSIEPQNRQRIQEIIDKIN